MNFERDFCLTPPMAQHFTPKAEECVCLLLGKPIRRIFHCDDSQLSENERKALRELDDFIEKLGFVLPEDYCRADLLRQLQGNDYDIEASFKNIEYEIKWRQQTLPVQLDDVIMDILNCGFMYLHGRDNRFRPLIFVDPMKFNKTKYAYDYWIKANIYLTEFLISKCLIPGRVENWTMIVDLKELTLLSIPFDLKNVFSSIKPVYRCRLYKLFLLNVNSVFQMAWNIAKLIMGPVIEAKVSIVQGNEGTHDDLFKEINRHQVEKKYGGYARDKAVNELFPFKCYSEELFINNEEDNAIKQSLACYSLDTFEEDGEIYFPAVTEPL